MSGELNKKYAIEFFIKTLSLAISSNIQLIYLKKYALNVEVSENL